MFYFVESHNSCFLYTIGSNSNHGNFLLLKLNFMDFCNISIFVCYQIKSDAELSDKEDDSPVKKAPSSPVHQRRKSPSPLEEVSDEEKQRRSVFIYKYKLHFFSNLNLFKPDSFI